MTNTTAPKAFISYSWTTPDHEQWVITLATELRQDGVDVVLDKWDLREGHDSISFMEQMVTNSDIKKVILICDKKYAEKTDSRSGGVGTEAQIISPELYAKRTQEKFVAVVAERNENGDAYLPTYYKSRIYIDLSKSEIYAENYERLLRWIFDSPLDVKPELGKRPGYLDEKKETTLGTGALARRVIDAFKSDKPYASGALDEYLTMFSENLERFRITSNKDNFDDEIVKSIDDLLPARNEFLSVVNTIVQYGDADACARRLHRFFESLLRYFFRPENSNQWSEVNSDNFRFFAHEIFLYSIATLLRSEKFSAVTHLLSDKYYIDGHSEYGTNALTPYTIFRQYLRSFEHRKSRTKSERISLRSDLLKDRSQSTGIDFRHLMQADFVCYLRAEIALQNDSWWPETLLYAGRSYGAFEIFSRAASRTYLINILNILGASSLDLITTKITQLTEARNMLPHWDYRRLNVEGLSGAVELGKAP